METPIIVALIAAFGSLCIALPTAIFAYKSKLIDKQIDEEKSSRDREEKARVAEIESRSAYVEILSRRVKELEERADRLNNIIREGRDEMDKQERRWRHFVNALIIYASICRVKAIENGLDLPRFRGFANFEREGGVLDDSWYGHLGLGEEDKEEIKFVENAVVLIIDDDNTWANTLKRIIEREVKEKVQIINRGNIAMEYLRICEYKLVIMDIVIAGESGIELAKKIHKEGIDVPIIAISGYPLDMNNEEIKKAGFVEVLSKTQRVLEIARIIKFHLKENKDE